MRVLSRTQSIQLGLQGLDAAVEGFDGGSHILSRKQLRNVLCAIAVEGRQRENDRLQWLGAVPSGRSERINSGSSSMTSAVPQSLTRVCAHSP